MSTNGNYGWKPRKTITLTCPLSEQKVQVRRPGPEFSIRAGRYAHIFTKKSEPTDRREGEGLNEYYARIMAELPDEELAGWILFGKELVLAMVISPKLVPTPDPEKDEIGPEDIGEDFWFLFNYAMQNFYGIKVPVGDGEVEARDLESFRAESGISGTSVDSAHIPPATESNEGDRGLLDGAGV